jgi:dihydrofolate reductase
MNIKCSVYIAASVDGFIARPDGDIEWLHRPEYAASELNGLSYDAFISTVDALVMGRNTFEKVLSFGHWPYEGTPVVVLSSRKPAIPDALQGKVRVDAGAPQEVVARLSAEGKRHLYIDGGRTIQRFLQAGLIHEITLTQIPILLGTGIPLFGALGIEVPLRLLDATRSDNGFVQVRYRVGGGTGSR